MYYNLSVMTQIDEVNEDRHMQMYLVEFVEGFARIADKMKFNLKPPMKVSSNNLSPNK